VLLIARRCLPRRNHTRAHSRTCFSRLSPASIVLCSGSTERTTRNLIRRWQRLKVGGGFEEMWPRRLVGRFPDRLRSMMRFYGPGLKNCRPWWIGFDRNVRGVGAAAQRESWSPRRSVPSTGGPCRRNRIREKDRGTTWTAMPDNLVILINMATLTEKQHVPSRHPTLIRRRIAESRLSFIELERRNGGQTPVANGSLPEGSSPSGWIRPRDYFDCLGLELARKRKGKVKSGGAVFKKTLYQAATGRGRRSIGPQRANGFAEWKDANEETPDGARHHRGQGWLRSDC